jgi:type I restriction enzyme S subunit
MASEYPGYSEYKETHLGWLSQVPSHWEVKRLKYLGDALIGLTYSPDDVVNEGEGTLVLRSSNVQNKQLAFDDNVYVNRKIPEKLITQMGDILICARNGSRSLIGKNAQIDENAAGMSFGAFMSIFRSPYNDYLSKVFNSPLFEYQSGSFLTATINQLTTGNLNSFEIPLPTEQEREKIANFLDHETAKIDTLIEKQQLLIKLLKEKRQAVISHAVTKGLNPNAPMRDSGVEWFSELPMHWRVGKLGYFAKISNGATPSRENLAFWEDGSIGWLNSSKVNDVRITEADQFITPLAFSQTSVQPVTNEDLVMAITGEGQTRGRVAICLIDATINQHLASISITDRALNFEFLFYYLISQYERIRYESSGAGSTKGAITCGDIVSFTLTVPPEEEQKVIIKYIVEKEAKFDSLIHLAVDQVALLEERRTALISAAVTGKIDVRHFNSTHNAA